HIAVAPVTAAERLAPGQHVGFVDGEQVGSGTNKAIGIVDPFLGGPVFKGDRFWMFLYPNTITALRHEWTHPEFGVGAESTRDSEQWLRRFARGLGVSYEDLLEHAREFVLDGSFWSEGGRFEGAYASDEFW